MTELSFLLELLLGHKLPRPTKEAITARIKEVEEKISLTQTVGYAHPIQAQMRPPKTAQAASTQRILDEIAAEQTQAPVAPVAQTPAAAQALAQRDALIAQALSGKEEKGRTAPRKF